MSEKMTTEMIGSWHGSLAELRDRFKNVQWADAGISFSFDGLPHIGRLRGRNADLVLGFGPEIDAAIATRVWIDGDSEPTTAADASLAAHGQPVGEWIPVTDRLPHARRPVLAAYQTNSRGWVIIRAEWVAAGTKESSLDSEIGEYFEHEDTYYDPEGWYEVIDNWDDYDAVTVIGGHISHWMEIPRPPDALKN